MSCSEIVLSKPVLIGLEAEVYKLQTKLLNITDLGVFSIYGLADKDVNSGFPKIWRDGKNYINLSPDDKLGGIMFFYENAAREYVDGNVLCFVSLVVWNNQTRIPSVRYKLQEELVAFVLKILRNSPNTSSEITIHTILEEVYSNFDIQSQIHTDAPYVCARFDFEIAYFDNCQPINILQNNC